MRRETLTIALAVAGLMAGGAGPADAYHLGGKKWPTRTITYHSSAKHYKSAIRQATRMWNASGVKIRFKAVKASKAKLKIVYGGSGVPSGAATLGWVPVHTVRTLDGGALTGDPIPCGTRIGGSRVKCHKEGPMVFLTRVGKHELGQSFAQREMVRIVAHELGHTLGLKHNHPACSIMSYRRAKTCARPAEPWRYRCRLIERDDLKGALKRYGGKAKPLAPEFCDAWTPVAAPTGLTATYDADRQQVLASWTDSVSADAHGVVTTFTKDRCTPYDPDEPYTFTQPGAANGEAFDPEGPGRYCISVWNLDDGDWTMDDEVHAGPAVSVWIDVPG